MAEPFSPAPAGLNSMTGPVVPLPSQPALPPWPGQQPPGNPICRICGSTPAAQVTFRRHTGMLLLMRFGSYQGPFCRDCGLYVYRKATAHTLLAGWWGWMSFFITPVIVVLNGFRRGTVARLAPPMPRPGGRLPANPGRPLYQRFAVVGFLVPLLVIGAIVASAVSSNGADSTAVGRCVHSTGDGHADLVDCGQPHEGIVTSVVDNKANCPADVIATLTEDDGSDGSTVLCVGQG